MEDTTSISQKMQELTDINPTPLFSTRVVSVEAIEQMIGAHQLKYIEFLIQAEEERKLAFENLQDLQAKYPTDIQEKALEHAEKAMYDPDYFTRNKIDPEFVMPIQIIGVIKAKKEEAKQKIWKLEYHARLVKRLRTFLESAKESEASGKKNFWQKIFGKFNYKDSY